MPAATVLRARPKRGLTKTSLVLLALVLTGGGVAAVVAADTAGAAPKSCAGKSCKPVSSPSPTPTASPSPTSASPTPSPTPTEAPTPQQTASTADTATPAPTASDSPTPTASATASPSNTATSSGDGGGSVGGTTTPDGTWVSPEGMKVTVDPSVVGWTPAKVYDVLRPNAYELDVVGPTLKIVVTNDPGNSTSTGAGTSRGVYTNFSAVMYLSARSDSMLNTRPDQVLAHEYGHAWTLYHLYLTQQKDWSKYLAFRGLAGDPRLDSTYLWDRKELIADDYRMLFGNDAAVSEASYINRDVADPRTVPGLKQFFTDTWA